MKLRRASRWTLLVALVAWAQMAAGQTALDSTQLPKVTTIQITHVGPPAVNDEMARSNMRVKVGEPYRRSGVDDDVRTLYATGYFHDVRVVEDFSPDGGVKLTYFLQRKPTVTDIKITGNTKFSSEKLRKAMKSKIGKPLDEKTLFTDAQDIQTKYQKAGYPKTTVRALPPVIDEVNGRGSVTFEVVETPKVRITEVVFEGATPEHQKKLRKLIKTRRHWMFSWLTGSGYLKDDEFDDDKDRIREFYQDEGFIDFDLKDVQFDYANPTRMVIRFKVDEGERYKIGSVTFDGNKLFTSDDILKGLYDEKGHHTRLRQTAGEIFKPPLLRKDVGEIEDFYGSKGYIGLSQSRSALSVKKVPNTDTRTIDLVYHIEEGEKSYIEQIEIKGNEHTRDKVIRRELAVSPGEVYDTVKVKLSKDRLEGLGYFEKVDTEAVDTEIPNRKNLAINLEEKSTGQFKVGAGFNSIDSLIGFVEVTEGNFDLFKPPNFFRGGGQKFRLYMAVGTERKDYELEFVEPWFLNKKLAFKVDLFHRDLGFLSDLYDEVHTGGTLGLTRALGSDFLIGSASYTLEQVDTRFLTMTGVSKELLMEKGHRLTSKIGLSLAYNTLNSDTLPSHGQRTELATELAGGPFGGENDFYKLEIKSHWYFPGFSKGHIFEVAARAGVVDSYDASNRVPLSDRFYLGGIDSLRGYKYRRVGPRDNFGEPIGGSTVWLGSLEYSLPVIERVRFAFFYDIGNVYADPYDFSDIGHYSDNVGIGLRINLPLGPIRLDYGVPITHDAANGNNGRFGFSVGFERPF